MSYRKIIEKNHPNNPCSITGDDTVYANIEWHGTPVPQATLDTDLAAVVLEDTIRMNLKAAKAFASQFIEDFQVNVAYQNFSRPQIRMLANALADVQNHIGRGDLYSAELEIADLAPVVDPDTSVELLSQAEIDVFRNQIRSFLGFQPI